MPPLNSEVAQFAESLAVMGEFMSVVVDSTAGYRAQLIGAGFGERAADDMAVQFHAHLMHILKGATGG